MTDTDCYEPEGGYQYEAVLMGGPGKSMTDMTVITQDVARLYDLVVGSMDWGSNMVDEEDRQAVAKLGILCGFQVSKCRATHALPKEDYAEGSIFQMAECQLPLTHAGPHGGQARVSEKLADAIFVPGVLDPTLVPVVNEANGEIFYRPAGMTEGQWATRAKYADSVFVDIEWESK